MFEKIQSLIILLYLFNKKKDNNNNLFSMNLFVILLDLEWQIFGSLLTDKLGAPFNTELMEDQSNMSFGRSVFLKLANDGKTVMKCHRLKFHLTKLVAGVQETVTVGEGTTLLERKVLLSGSVPLIHALYIPFLACLICTSACLGGLARQQ